MARRIAVMSRISPEIAREIERIVEKKLSARDTYGYAAGGFDHIAEILNLTDRANEKQIIESLEDEAPDIAEEIKKRLFVFEDIVMLDDCSVQKVLRETDAKDLILSLKSVDSEVQDKIFRNLSESAAAKLKEDIEYIGAVRLKDVEEAQQKIVSIIRRLEDTGEIFISHAGEYEMVV